MTQKLYSPRPGTLPSMCIGFFENNPDEELTIDDIIEKFGGSHGNIHTNLRLALDAGMLARRRNEDGEYIYVRGNGKKPADAAPPLPAAAWAKPEPQATTSKGYSSPRKNLDFEKLVVEKGIPFSASHKKGERKWDALFNDKLIQVGTSTVIPMEFLGAAKAACAHRNKQGRGTFKAAKINSTQGRVWRIA